MEKTPTSIAEAQRVADLRQLDILLTTPEEAFDAVTQELARIFKVTGAFITFIDEDTQYYKSAVGLPAKFAATRTVPREKSICTHVVSRNKAMVVEDLLADERFRENPVVRESGARFYAGTPLRSEGNRPLGALCIVDEHPRTMSEREVELLRMIAEGVMAQVKLQAVSRQLLQRTTQIEQDLEHAIQVQRFLLPDTNIAGDGWRICHLYQPVSHLGGDFLDVYRREDGQLAILLADVSGHGVSAAFTAAMTKTAFLRAASSVNTPVELLDAIHRELVGTVRPGQFMSAVAMLFEPSRRVIEMASAGHPYPLLISETRAEIVEHVNDLLMLVFEEQKFKEQTMLTLGGGDRLLVYTDGAIEVSDDGGSMLGLEGFRDLVQEVAREGHEDFLGELLARLSRHAAGSIHDDIALLCIESI